MVKYSVLALLTLTLLLTNVGLGQPRQGRSGREGLMRSFDHKAPAVGELLPDLRAYNAVGETIRLGELKGDYTVLVFGCLT